MEIYSGLIAYLEPLGKKNVNAASLDTHKEQCLQNPLIFFPSAIQYVCVFTLPYGKVFILSLSLLILFFHPRPLIVTSHQRRKLQLLHFTNC